MILNEFLNSMRNMVYGDSETMPTHIAVGIGTTAVTATDTTLDNEIFPDGANRCAISGRSKPTDKKFRMQVILGRSEANGRDITEIGAVNAATAGTLHNRVVIPKIVKDASYELLIQIEDTFSNV